MVELYYVTALEWQCLQDPITTGDGKFFVDAPYDGEFLGARAGHKFTGVILTAGSGAGTYTEVQIRNATQGRDYFTTLPRFEVDDADVNGRAPLSGGVLSTQPTFRAGDRLWLDVDGIPGGSDSANLMITCPVGMRRTV